MPEIGQKTAEGVAMESFETVHQDMPRTVELPVAIEEQTLPLRPAEVWMTPGGSRSIQTIEILFRNPTPCEEIVVLLCSGNRGQDVEGRNVRIEAEQDVELLANAFCRVFGKTDDV